MVFTTCSNFLPCTMHANICKSLLQTIWHEKYKNLSVTFEIYGSQERSQNIYFYTILCNHLSYVGLDLFTFAFHRLSVALWLSVSL